MIFYYKYTEVPLNVPSILFWHSLFAIYFYKQHHVAGETDGCTSTIDSRWFRKESEECTLHSCKQVITILTWSKKFNEVFFSTSGLFYEFLHVGYRILYSPTLLSRKATSAALDTFSFTFVNGQEQILESRDEQVQYKKTDNIEQQKRCR